jgi:hypothetical protein
VFCWSNASRGVSSNTLGELVNTEKRILIWLTQVNLGAALGIFAYLACSNVNPILLEFDYQRLTFSPVIEAVGEIRK